MVPADLKDYLNLDYAIVLQRDEEGDWVATIKELEGCVADGPTPDEAIRNLQSMKELWLKVRARSRRPIPLPAREQDIFSGKYLQRVPRSLHRKLVAAAEQDGVSLNQFTSAVLAEAVGEKAAKSTKGAAVSVVAVANINPWSMCSGSVQSEWQTRLHTKLDRRKRDHSLRCLTKNTPETVVNPIGRELKSGDEETHQTWNA